MKISESKFHFFSGNALFVFFSMACGFLISAEYAVTRPASNSFFISTYGANFLPYAWIATIPLNFLVIHFYNKFLPGWGPFKTFLSILLMTILINTLSAFYIKEWLFMPFLQYIWKDIYILLMFKQMWSLIHTTIKKEAKVLYGIVFGVGGLGAVLGSMIPSFFALRLGSENLFLFTLPIYGVFSLFYYQSVKRSGLKTNGKDFLEELSPSKISAKEGFSLIKKSRALTFALLIVVLMQFSISLADFQFNLFLEKAIADIDLRTEFTGRILSLINGLMTIFQFLGGFLLIHFLGIKRTHLLIPCFLMINASLMLVFPTFALASFVYVLIKTLDYSVFNILREMLYIPLNLDEKFRAKAVIDVFAYRTAKGIGSLFILFLQKFALSSILFCVSGVSISIFFVWALVVGMMFKKKPSQLESPERVETDLSTL